MDRKGWIILILCSVALMFTYNMGQQNKAAQAKIDSDKAELDRKSDQIALDAKKLEDDQKSAAAGDSANPSAPATPVAPAKPVQQEELLVLTAKNGDADSVSYTFTNLGGGVKFAEVLGQKQIVSGKKIEHTEENIRINEHSGYTVGAIAKDYKSVEKTFYKLVESGSNYVVFEGTLSDGVTVSKRWTVEHSDDKLPCRLKLDLSFKAASGSSISLGDYALVTGTALPLYGKEQQDRAGFFYYQDGDYEHDEQGEFTGGMFSDEKSVVEHNNLDGLEYVGVDNQFFTTTIFPTDTKADSFWAAGEEFTLDSVKRWKFLVGLNLPDKQLSGGNSTSFSYLIYMGSKLDKAVPNLSSNSDDIMNYSSLSAFSWISGGMNWVLNGIHGWFPESATWSWGAAIILLTIFIRIIIWPLHNKSTRTMKRMSKLQPIMKELKEKHADNPQKLNQETMKLYREYGVNPMGGCLPMLVQIPIFFGVFNMITGAIELRGQSFLWVNDLSLPDTVDFMPGTGWPINLLPILMAVTMVLQMRMTPQTGEKMQRRIMMLMPLMFFFFCYGYAAALALYWTTQNIVSIFQTWLTNRLPEAELVRKSDKRKRKGTVEVMDDKPRKKGLVERLAEKLEDAQKQRDAAAGIKPAKKTAAPTTAKKAKKRSPKTGG